MKMLVFDLDGTLLDKDRNMPSENIEYLSKLKKDGYIIVFASGRSLFSAYDKLNKSDFVNYIIADTGSVIYDLDKKEYLQNKTIPKETAIELLNLYNEKFMYIDICSDGIYQKYSLVLKENKYYVKTYENKNELINNINKINHIGMSLINNRYVVDMYNYVMEKYKNLDCIIMQDSFSHIKYLEIFPKGVSKYNAICDLAKSLDISNDEIMVFGDGLNDIEMIEKFKHGVAMANALDEVKEKANYVTNKSNEEFGVIDFLEEYLNENDK